MTRSIALALKVICLVGCLSPVGLMAQDDDAAPAPGLQFKNNSAVNWKLEMIGAAGGHTFNADKVDAKALVITFDKKVMGPLDAMTFKAGATLAVTLKASKKLFKAAHFKLTNSANKNSATFCYAASANAANVKLYLEAVTFADGTDYSDVFEINQPAGCLTIKQ